MSVTSGNFGIIQYITGGNAASYVDVAGATRAAATNLSNAAWRRSDIIQLGVRRRCLVTVSGVLGAMQSVKVRAEIRNTDPRGVTSGITWDWCPIAMERGDGSAAPNLENTIAVADFTGIDSAARDVTLMTTNTGPSGDFSVIVETVNAAAATDAIVIAVWVL